MPRLIAVILFGLMGLVEAFQAYRLLRTLADPAPVAERLGISYGAEILRAGILLVLALAVTLGALLAVVGLLAGCARSSSPAPSPARSGISCSGCTRWRPGSCN